MFQDGKEHWVYSVLPYILNVKKLMKPFCSSQGHMGYSEVLMRSVERALISVYDKKGLVELAGFLRGLNVELVSTGGTGKALKEAGIEYKEVSELTGFPEIMDGRVKTLHPLIHGGILGRRDLDTHREQMRQNKIEPIDIVIINLYPFEKVTDQDNVLLEDAIENIDIGGPAMIRAAAKNYNDVLVVVEFTQYEKVISHIKEHKGASTLEFRFDLAKEAFKRTAGYDSKISEFLAGINDPTIINIEQARTKLFRPLIHLEAEKVMDLRYGENPHQSATLYREAGFTGASLAMTVPLQGKELSFNNICDFESAWRLAWEFEKPCCTIIKHGNPCGVGLAGSVLDAFIKAKATDPVSAFGGVIAFNREVDSKAAAEITAMFVEGVIAPSFSPEALELFAKKKNVRLLACGKPVFSGQEIDIKKIIGGMLIQTLDTALLEKSALKCVTKRTPSDDEMKALMFAWTVAKYVKSNAIVYAVADRTIGVGAGQMSRVDSAKIGIMKAKEAGLEIKGSVLASDAFFPFRDSVNAAAEAGVTAVIEPGGSIHDSEVITAADEHNIAMLFTGMRHFRH
jgi:phosphoribosylaminoimidazolecarboxamide formyltransferase/IMP cyclohydrolase